VLTVRIDLIGAHPPIWRWLELWSDLTLDKVHALIQAVFEWENSQLHEFASLSADGTMVEQRFESHFQQEVSKDMDLGLGGASPMGDEEEATLGSLLRKQGDMLFYTYDFGDSWEHKIALEKVLPADPGMPLAKCAGDAKAGPPDDCGGIWNYLQLVDMLKHPDHPDYKL
jgi:hypothetical protein